MNLLTATLDELLITSTQRDRSFKKKLLDNLPMGTVFELLVFSEKELLALPGIGSGSIAYLKFCLIANGFRLREDNEVVISWINTLADKAGGYPLTLLNFERPLLDKLVYSPNGIVEALWQQGAELTKFLRGLTVHDISILTSYDISNWQPMFDVFEHRAKLWGYALESAA